MEDLISQEVAEHINYDMLKRRWGRSGCQHIYLRIPLDMVAEDILDSMSSHSPSLCLNKYGMDGILIERIPGYKNIYSKAAFTIDNGYVKKIIKGYKSRRKKSMITLTVGCTTPRSLSKYLLVEQIDMNTSGYGETDIDIGLAKFMTIILCKPLDPLVELSIVAKIRAKT